MNTERRRVDDRAGLLRRLLEIGYDAEARGASPEAATFVDQLLISMMDECGPALASAIACTTAEEYRRRRTCPTCGTPDVFHTRGGD